ncbi:HAD hydrolase family protein [Jeotgalibacillus sp. ET6]
MWQRGTIYNQEEIIAVGDSYNDLSMIEYAGLGC